MESVVLGKKIGKGTFGVIYEWVDQGETKAVKMYFPNDDTSIGN